MKEHRAKTGQDRFLRINECLGCHSSIDISSLYLLMKSLTQVHPAADPMHQMHSLRYAFTTERMTERSLFLRYS